MGKKELKEHVFIIDGSSFLYRAYYSIRELTTKEGVLVNAVYGFCRMIKKLTDTYNPNYMIVIWDSKGPNFRHELYKEYKQTRQAPPSGLFGQKDLIKEFCEAINLKSLEVSGVEADDVMFSLAKELQEHNNFSLLITSDKDLRQSLDKNIIILDPFKDIILTQDILEEKLGFSTEKLPFYYGLIGDASDNIPGVKGVGPKTAEQLVKKFSSLEMLYENITEVSSDRIRNLLLKFKDNAFLSQELFRAKYYKTGLTKEDCKFSKDNWQNAMPLFEKFEFKSLLKSSSSKVSPPKEDVLGKKYNFKAITTASDLNVLCEEIKKIKYFAADTECIGIYPLKSEIIGISICIQENTSYYIPFGHKLDIQDIQNVINNTNNTNNTQESKTQLDKKAVIEALKPIFEDEKIEKYFHHAKFDCLVLYKAGISVKNVAFDTLIAASLLVKDGQKIGLKKLSEYYFQEPMLSFSDVVKQNKYKDFSYVPIKLATSYAAADAHQTLKLYKLFKKQITELNVQDTFYSIEMPLMRILVDMEKAGILVDKKILSDIEKVVSKEIHTVKEEIIKLAGEKYLDINLNSPKQIEELLFSSLNLPAVKKTGAKSSYSTDYKVLKELSKLHVIPGLIIKYRELFKLKSTYLDTLSTHININTKRVHTSFNQTSVSTGRLASSDPNLQNIPVYGFNIRSAFKVKTDYIMLSADYSQIELRVLAYLSQDKTLIEAFQNSLDIHALTAANLFEVPTEEVTTEQRQIGKKINFSILYGLTAHGLSKDLDISHSTASQYIKKFMAQYSGVAEWMDQVVQKTKEKGYVETLFNRKRYLPGIYEKNRTIFDLARRVAINTVAQGTAAELVKMGMIQVDKLIKENSLNSKIILQIHDELLLEVSEKEIEQTKVLVESALQNIVSWNIPLIVNIKTGLNWQEVTK